MLITLPDGDQARHRVLLLLLHSQYMVSPKGSGGCSTENKAKAYYNNCDVLFKIRLNMTSHWFQNCILFKPKSERIVPFQQNQSVTTIETCIKQLTLQDKKC